MSALENRSEIGWSSGLEGMVRGSDQNFGRFATTGNVDEVFIYVACCSDSTANYSVKRFLSPAIPKRPVLSSNRLVGSGTELVISPWTVVIPLFEAGGTRFNGLLETE
jgi:hypothetical protein